MVYFSMIAATLGGHAIDYLAAAYLIDGYIRRNFPSPAI
jgi:hypothetical protein